MSRSNFRRSARRQMSTRGTCSSRVFARSVIFIVRKIPRLASHLLKTQVPLMWRTAVIGFVIGMTLGCLCGAALSFFPDEMKTGKAATLSVNAISGRAQLHIKGTGGNKVSWLQSCFALH